MLIKLILSYLLGSVSGSILVGKLKGIDIREKGSGNAGGTNAFRIMGAKFALLVLFIDIAKGFLAVKFIPLLKINKLLLSNINIDILPILCGCFAVLGHVYPIYHNFKGGKGAGTMVGVLLALFPMGLLICFLSWLFVLFITGYVGLSTIIAGIILPVVTGFYYKDSIFSIFGYFTIFIALFIIFTHRSNIIRMINGEENRFKRIMFFNKKTN